MLAANGRIVSRYNASSDNLGFSLDQFLRGASNVANQFAPLAQQVTGVNLAPVTNFLQPFNPQTQQQPTAPAPFPMTLPAAYQQPGVQYQINRAQQSATNKWLLPVGIGGGVLLLVVLLMRK